MFLMRTQLAVVGGQDLDELLVLEVASALPALQDLGEALVGVTPFRSRHLWKQLFQREPDTQKKETHENSGRKKKQRNTLAKQIQGAKARALCPIHRGILESLPHGQQVLIGNVPQRLRPGLHKRIKETKEQRSEKET